jgi:hypothetical protein
MNRWKSTVKETLEPTDRECLGTKLENQGKDSLIDLWPDHRSVGEEKTIVYTDI